MGRDRPQALLRLRRRARRLRRPRGRRDHGALLTGVFAVNEFSGHSGLLEGDVGQFINQIKGVVTVIVYDAIVTFVILKIVDVAVGLRVSEEVERDGLDLALHGEVVH